MIAKVCEWADRHPRAMRRLIEDAELQAHLLEALDDLAPESKSAGADEAASRSA